MRFAWLCLALAACDPSPPSMPPMPTGTPPMPTSCPRACAAVDSDCATVPYERLPERCFEVCYAGSCYELVDGAWRTATIDCARPVTDAGVDATPVDA